MKVLVTLTMAGVRGMLVMIVNTTGMRIKDICHHETDGYGHTSVWVLHTLLLLAGLQAMSQPLGLQASQAPFQ